VSVLAGLDDMVMVSKLLSSSLGQHPPKPGGGGGEFLGTDLYILTS